MQKTTKLQNLIATTFLVLLFSCGSDEQAPIDTSLPIVTTVTAEILNSSTVKLNGTFTAGGSTIASKGFCWSTEPNPTFIFMSDNSTMVNHQSQEGPFTDTVIDKFTPGSTYYIKAFIIDHRENVYYGNEISITLASTISTLDPTEILATSATLNGNLIQTSNLLTPVAFVYSTSPNPTTNNNFSQTFVQGTANYSLTIQNLSPNTTYYIRAVRQYHIENEIRIIYGEQKQLKTTGYTGPAGGYVAYDKGMITDGWRYLEIFPTTLTTPTTQNGAYWSVNSTFVSGLSNQFGSGPTNTQLIANSTNQSNCAAKLCLNYTKNGFNDWFLGSADEMVLIYNSLTKAGMISGQSAWTSSQYNANEGIYISSSGATGQVLDYYEKAFPYRVFPIRRY